jgi:ABC-2 type transport system permease protein
MSSAAPTSLPPQRPGLRVSRGTLGVYALQVRNEVLAARRSVEFVVGLVAIPTLLYAMFGLPNSSAFTPGGPPFSTIAVGSFGAYGIVSLAIFTFGDEVARERGRGWLRTLRATPVPAGAYLVAKLAMAMVYATLIVAALAAVSVPTGAAELTLGQWIALTAVLVAGVVAFSTVGLALAYLVKPKAATTIANLLFLPLSFASGFFFPLSELPALLRDVAPYLPTYHLGQLVWRVVATEADAAALTGMEPQSIVVHVSWVLGCTVVGATVALWAARREAVTRRG